MKVVVAENDDGYRVSGQNDVGSRARTTYGGYRKSELAGQPGKFESNMLAFSRNFP